MGNSARVLATSCDTRRLMKTQIHPSTRSVFVAGACLLVLSSAACGGEPGGVDSSEPASVSEALTACTPAALPIALASASSRQAAAFAPKYAIDGNPAKRWSSDQAATQALVLDLGKVVNVSGLSINWQTAYSKAFTVDYSLDGVNNWTPFIVSGASAAGVQNVSGVAVTRYVRIHSTEATSWHNVSIIDVQVLGTVDSACGNLLKSSWAFSSEDFEPPTFDASTVYSVNGNGIVFTYQGKLFTISGPQISGIHFKQPVQLVQGGKYRLRLDISNFSGASTTVWWASLSGAAAPTDFVTADSNGSTAIDFTVTAAPGATPVIELVNKPITVFPGAGVQNFTVTATLTKTN